MDALRTPPGSLTSVTLVATLIAVMALPSCAEDPPPPKPVVVDKPPPPPPPDIAVAKGPAPILARLPVDDKTGKVTWIAPGDAAKKPLVHSAVPPEIEAMSLVALPAAKGCEQCADQRAAIADAADEAALGYVDDKEGVLAAVAAAAIERAGVKTKRPALAALVDRCANVHLVVAGGFDASSDRAVRERVAKMDPEAPCQAAPPPALPATLLDPGRRLLQRAPGRKLEWLRTKKGPRHEVVDGRVSLGGRETYQKARQGEDLRFGDAPVLMALGATWCVPCGEELGDVLAMAERVHQGHGVRVVLVSLDAGSRGPAGLRNSFDKLFRMYRDTHAFSPALEPPAWVELRGDPEGAWLGLADAFFADADKAKEEGLEALREGGIPMTLLFDGCGHLHLVAQEKLDPATIAKIEARAAALAKADKCGTIGSGK